MGHDFMHHQPLPMLTTPLRELVHLDRTSDIPLYQQICRGLREAILSGELAEGVRLPTERAFARELGVNRTTVMNAYHELASEGLIEGHVGRGTMVRRNDIDHDGGPFDHSAVSWLLGLSADEDALLGSDGRIIGEIVSANTQEEGISLSTGSPDTALLPAELVRAIFAECLPQARQVALGYCPVEGLQSLRRGIAARMRGRGVAIDYRHILVLSGSTQGIGLVGRFLLNPGDEVIVEVPTYIGAIQVFRALGARIIGIPTDSDGMRVDLLEPILARRRPRLIYTAPTFQNPTGVVLSAERRRRLLQLAKRYQVPILEDDAYGELYLDGRDRQPLKALDTNEFVLYLGTYSKTLAPGLRVAWLAASPMVIERLFLHKQVFDLNTNALGQWLVSEMLQQNVLDDHLTMVRDHYRRKRDIALQAIEEYWPTGVRVMRPNGGFHLWCRLPNDMRARMLLREAAREQVSFVIGEPFHVDGGGGQHIRLSFSAPNDHDLQEGIRRIGIAMKRMMERRVARGEPLDTPVEHMPVM